MPSRVVVARELAEVFKVMAHADRIRIIAEIGTGELDVNTIAERLELSGPRVSQHLSLMRMQRIVEERRDGRHHYYHLVQPEIAQWIVDGLTFLEGRGQVIEPSNIDRARRLWSESDSADSVSAKENVS